MFHFLGDKEKMEKAAKDAIPNFEEMKEMEAQVTSDQEELKKLNRQKEIVITAH